MESLFYIFMCIIYLFQERRAMFKKIHSIVNIKEPGILALSPDLDFKPLSVEMLSARIS